MEILSGLVVVVVFMTFTALAIGAVGERFGSRKNEQFSLTQQQQDVVDRIESLSPEDRRKFFYGDYTLQPTSDKNIVDTENHYFN